MALQSFTNFKLIVLIDNNSHPERELFTEHGLSIYFEADNLKCLFDVGASDAFYYNAQRLGVKLEEVDHLILSHGHKDHTGGLEKFLEINAHAKIFLSDNIIGQSFYSSRKGVRKDISTSYDIRTIVSSRLELVKEDRKIGNSIELIGRFSCKYPLPIANNTLFVKSINEMSLDSFEHEVALCVHTNKGDVVLSACTHNGILNTLSACTGNGKGADVIAYIGGTHLIDSDDQNQYETKQELHTLAENLLHCYPKMKLITGHCTGSNTMQLLKRTMGTQFEQFYSGYCFSI